MARKTKDKAPPAAAPHVVRILGAADLAERAALEERLAEIEAQLEKRDTLRDNLAIMAAVFERREDGELFIKAVNTMIGAGHFAATAHGIDALCSQADLRRFCETFGFNRWAILKRYFTLRGAPLGSIESQHPAEDVGPTPYEYTVAAGSMWPAMRDALHARGLLV
ncbi:MAG: hypothetical protein ABSF77_18615 [Spirochaetia bacterium]|jgi:hypothetical protein